MQKKRQEQFDIINVSLDLNNPPTQKTKPPNVSLYTYNFCQMYSLGAACEPADTLNAYSPQILYGGTLVLLWLFVYS